MPDIFVSNSQSNTVSELNGLGQGFFNDQTPRIFDVGTDPGPLFVGNFDGRAGLDLVPVTAGSNDLTLLSNFAIRLDISTGGLLPVAAATGDYNKDGIGDLLVTNNGSGGRWGFQGGTGSSLRSSSIFTPARCASVRTPVKR